MTVELLFSYGTLRQPEVQRATFGRELPSRPDALPGFTLDTVVITDPAVVALSGSAVHPFARPTGRADDEVAGVVLELTPEQLAAADEYEVDDYTRVAVTLRSGARAWMYVAASSAAGDAVQADDDDVVKERVP